MTVFTTSDVSLLVELVQRISKRSETSKQVPDAQLVSDSEPTKLDDLDGGGKRAEAIHLVS